MDDYILVGIDETNLTTFDFIRKDALQNNLFQFLKYFIVMVIVVSLIFICKEMA